MADAILPTEVLLAMVLILAAIAIVLAVVIAIRSAKSGTRRMELELEKQKLSIVQQDIEKKAKEHPFSRLSAEQIGAIRTIEEENDVRELNIYAKEKIVEARLRRLENMVREAKLDRMQVKLDTEERKVK
jgi:DNA integrity scanning protein DisA with diadenylate cyclase activity